MVGPVIFLAVSFIAAVSATLAGFGSSALLVPVAVALLLVGLKILF
ncbi:MAG: hypothetical protein JXB23_06480 [Candidatus Aminicenantes bacterium]|nr:hypothetical protein [Candidatus Aminicenantes bacterium]